MKRALLAVAILAPLSAHAIPANQGEANTSANAWPFRVTDGTHDLTLLNSAPGSDTGQVAVPVRILSGLSLNVTGTLTDTQLRASPVPVSGTFWQTTQPVSGTFWQTTQPVSGTFWQTTQPISAAALPLPSGASTETTLALIKAKTDNIDVALSTRTKPADTQTVSGTVTANAGTGTFAVSGPLTDTQLRASAVPVSGTFYQATQPVSGTVAVSGTVPVSGTFWQATQPVSGSVTASQGGTWTVQPGNTANTTAWKVDGSAVTQPVSGTFWQATQPVSGTVTANAGSGTMAVSGPLTDTQLRATAVPVSGTFYQATQPVSGTVTANAAQSGTWTVQPGNTANTTAWKVDGSAVTQPVSGTVTANAGSGTMAVSGPLTDTQLRATAVPVSGTFFQATQPVSGTVTANAGSGTMAVSGTFWQATQPVSGTVAATESGTWTVQPGNTANSTPWLTTDSATSATASAVPAKSAYVGANVLALGSAPTAVSAGNLAGLAVDTQNRLLVNNFHPNFIVCNLLTTATSSTSLAGSCGAPGASKSVYITDISIGGGVATSATAPAIIQTGTGGTCGTGTTVLYRCNHGATAGCEAHFTTPIKAAANSEVCILDGVTGTKSVTAQGFIAP